MSTTQHSGPSDFDPYAQNYDAALAQGLAASGEGRDYFAQGRIAWLAGQLRPCARPPASVLDFGCGTGATVPLLLDLLGARSVVGVEASTSTLEVARRNYGSERTRFLTLQQFEPVAEIDLAYCNGVFHHIPPQERAAALQLVFRALRPGGWFAFWENNPWNPGTRYIMRRIPFDRDAIPITPPEARQMLMQEGFEIQRTDFLFIFPRLLRGLRFLEPWLAAYPLGGQYQVLCRKPQP